MKPYPFNAVMLAVDGEGAFEVIGCVHDLEEAQELAREDFSSRDPNEDMCPSLYVIHGRDGSGRYVQFDSVFP